MTARDVFLLVLSSDAMNSLWVRREINIALNRNKYIIPLLHRACSIRADLEIIQIISFLAPRPYDVAFQEVLSALGLPKEAPLAQHKRASQPTDPTDATTMLIQHMETAFADHDWPDVIRKATYLIKHTTGNVSSSVYRMQGIALVEEGKMQAAQEAFETALALVSERALRLTLLGDYTTLLARQEQWDEVLQQAREALHLVPNDPGWLATQQQAQRKRVKPVAVPPSPTPSQKPTPTRRKTKAQWLEEGTALYNLKRYEEALTAFDQAIRLDPNDAGVYSNKGAALQHLGKHREAQQARDRAKQLGYSS